MAGEKTVPPVTGSTRVELRELVVHREPGRSPILGCEAARRYMEVEETTLAAVEALRGSATVAEAEARLLKETGEEYDLADLVMRFVDRGFVRSLDGVLLVHEARDPALYRWLKKLPPARLTWMHHPATFAVVGALALLWIALMLADPWALPGIQDVVVAERLLYAVLVPFCAMLVIASLHELSHYLMARSYGVDSRFKLSYRVVMVVFETDVSNAWLRRPHERIHIFLAGIGFNVALCALAGLAAWLGNQGLLPMPLSWIPILRMVVVLSAFPVLFQLLVFARTDLYYVLSVLLKERNLAAHARAYLRLRLYRVARPLLRVIPERCPACQARSYWDEPFCLRCGVHRPSGNRFAYPFAFASQRKLLVVGLWFFAAQAAFMAWFFLRVLPYQARALGTLWQSLRPAVTGWGSLLHATVLDLAVVMALLAAQMALVSFFLLRPLLQWAFRQAQAFRRRRAAASAGAAGASSLPSALERSAGLADRPAALANPETPKDG